MVGTTTCDSDKGEHSGLEAAGDVGTATFDSDESEHSENEEDDTKDTKRSGTKSSPKKGMFLAPACLKIGVHVRLRAFFSKYFIVIVNCCLCTKLINNH